MALIHRWIAASLIVFAFAACTSGDDASTPTTTPPPLNTAEPTVAPAKALAAFVAPGPYAVGVRTLEMVDTSRPVAPNGDYPGEPERRMSVDVWYPAMGVTSDATARDAALDARGGPYPLIVFAHGFSSSRVQSTTYTRHLASHGYVVAAPDFPLTRAGAPGGPNFLDTVNQPADVSFVITEMIAAGADAAGPLAGAIDPERIGLTGHSGGAFTTLLALYGEDADPRIDAAVALSGSGCFLTEEDVGDTAVPVMLMTGSEDLLIPAEGNRIAYDLANPPRYWVELIGGNHVRFADADVDDELVADRVRDRVAQQAEDASGEGRGALFAGAAACDVEPTPTGVQTITLARQQELLRTFATPFFDAYLREDAAALRFLQDDLPALTEGAADYEFDAPSGGSTP